MRDFLINLGIFISTTSKHFERLHSLLRFSANLAVLLRNSSGVFWSARRRQKMKQMVVRSHYKRSGFPLFFPSYQHNFHSCPLLLNLISFKKKKNKTKTKNANFVSMQTQLRDNTATKFAFKNSIILTWHWKSLRHHTQSL